MVKYPYLEVTMKTVTVIISSFLFVFNSCEPCRDDVGKERIEISQWTVVIDSVKIDDSFAFSKYETEQNTLYSTGWINTDETNIELMVYSNSIATELQLEVKDDQFIYIVLADTSEHMCTGNGSLHNWETFSKNNIDVCLFYEELECP
jgi:hypothetical protein